MEFKPDTSLLAAYLYDEVDCALSEKIKAYLESRTDAMAEFKALQDTRAVLAMLEDDAFEAPLIVPIPSARFSWIKGFPLYQIAAVLIPLLLVAVASMIYLSRSVDTSTPIARAVEAKKSGSLSKEEVLSMIQTHKSVAQDSLIDVIRSLQQKIATAQPTPTRYTPVVPVSEQSDLVSKEDMLAAFDQYRMESTQSFLALLAEERRQQELYVEQLISGLNQYYDTRRDADLKNIELALDNMLENQSIQRSKTDYLLGALLEKGAQKDQNGTQQNK